MKIVKESYQKEYDEVIINLKVLMSRAELCSSTRSKQIEKNFKYYPY